ncbi:MAG: malate synthase A [Bdellovibrio sp.]|nr:MAG: malate synthase A [Bdellovibrio sp.]
MRDSKDCQFAISAPASKHTLVGEILPPQACKFLLELHQNFDEERRRLLKARQERQKRFDAGEKPDFHPETSQIRKSAWKVTAIPPALQDRRVEITGPAEPKMVINALNSGAKVFMADFEDALSPTWDRLLEGQQALKAAVRHSLRFEAAGKSYALNKDIATLMVRPRGWHLEEGHVHVGQQGFSASLFDFGLFFFHNARECCKRQSGPFYYLPKLESHLEARLWNKVIEFAEKSLDIPRFTTKVTVLIETLPAAFEMEEILFELKDYIVGLNAGRWDYLFSGIKRMGQHRDFVLPHRSFVPMTVPFMKAYTDLLVQTCHKRGAHAMGGMAAFVPNRSDPVATEKAIEQVQADKQRECRDGFDGTWVAHPDLVSVAMKVFVTALQGQPHQKDKLREEVKVLAKDLLSFSSTPGEIPMAGLRSNIDVAARYIERWISGQGAVALYNLMEDAATAEICRAQLWQWIHHRSQTKEGQEVSLSLVLGECRKIEQEIVSQNPGAKESFTKAFRILRGLVEAKEIPEFLTSAAYPELVLQC